MEIAVIITCFNRKNKTIASLGHLFEACNYYNSKHAASPIRLSIYLTDDGCTDGTAEAVKEACEGYCLHIIQGHGQCYWAGGMRLAWNEALKKKDFWDFYLLLNDDTMVFNNVFDQLFNAHQFALNNYQKPGLYSGITCDIKNKKNITYGGEKITGKFQADSQAVKPQDIPVEVDKANANILLVAKDIVNDIGIFYEGYIHGCADYDYSMQAHKHNYPVLVTAQVCGACEFDHPSGTKEIHMLNTMTYAQRIAYIKNPVHSDHDYLLCIKRNIPHKYYISWFLRKIRIICPNIYKIICICRRLNAYK